jgi:hypothetical protein
LLVPAGVSEVENRILYQGDVTGWYAIVPVEGLVADEEAGDDVLGFDTESQLEEMQIVGEFAHVAADGGEHVTLYKDGEQIAEFGSKGAYGNCGCPTTSLLTTRSLQVWRRKRSHQGGPSVTELRVFFEVHWVSVVTCLIRASRYFWSWLSQQ